MKIIDDEINGGFKVKFDTDEERKDFIESIKGVREAFCKCDERKEDEQKEKEEGVLVDNTHYVENYNGVHHGWVCNYCGDFTQIG